MPADMPNGKQLLAGTIVNGSYMNFVINTDPKQEITIALSPDQVEKIVSTLFMFSKPHSVCIHLQLPGLRMCTQSGDLGTFSDGTNIPILIRLDPTAAHIDFSLA